MAQKVTSWLSAFALVLSSQAIAAPHKLPTEFDGSWTAFSRTARAITGDIVLSSSKIVFEKGQELQLAFVRRSRGVSLDQGNPLASVFRVTARKDIVLSNQNTLCGGGHAPTYLVFNKTNATLMTKSTNGEVAGLYLTVYYGEEWPDVESARLCASYDFLKDVPTR